jgi:hypothetical protein
MVTDGSVQITPAFDECAGVIVTASPASTHVDQSVAVSASVSGTDAGLSAFTYRWTASAGRFASASAAATTFTCPGMDHAGPAILTLTVSDGSACEVKRMLTVACLARADAGTGPDAAIGDAAQPDSSGAGGAAGAGGASGMGGGGGAVAQCQGDPSLCEGDSCNECTSLNCVADTDGCGHLPSDRERVKCWALYACIRDSGCLMGTNSDVYTCWCGEEADVPRAMSLTRCVTGKRTAAGPCAQVFVDTAGSADPAFIDQHIIDPATALGSAINLASCRMSFCSKENSPDPAACPLW